MFDAFLWKYAVFWQYIFKIVWKNKIDAFYGIVMDSQYINGFVYSTHLLYQTYSILSRMSYKKIRHHFCAGSSFWHKIWCQTKWWLEETWPFSDWIWKPERRPALSRKWGSLKRVNSTSLHGFCSPVIWRNFFPIF